MRCFVVGNGPSITPERLDKLKNDATFAVGAIAAIFDKTEWRPTHYVATTSCIFHGLFRPYILRAIDEAGAVWACSLYSAWVKRPDVHWLDCRHENEIEPGDYWSDSPLEWVSKYGTSIFAVLQIASFLGYNPIYLVGCDGYTGKLHFDGYPDHPDFAVELAQYKLLAAHKVAAKARSEMGVTVYVVGESCLDMYERIDHVAGL